MDSLQDKHTMSFLSYFIFLVRPPTWIYTRMASRIYKACSSLAHDASNSVRDLLTRHSLHM